jgi:hypothetical protein
MKRELQGIEIVNPESLPREVQRLHTSFNLRLGKGNDMSEINSAITLDPGEPLSLKAATSGPEKEEWPEAIVEKLIIFYQEEYGKKFPRREVENKQKIKLITTNWIY